MKRKWTDNLVTVLQILLVLAAVCGLVWLILYYRL